MEKKRNGLLEIYRFILCFWPLYHHNFFFFERDYSIFTVAELAVDFFFMLSGFFLMRAMRRLKDEPVLRGMSKLMLGRTKSMAFTMCFIAAFNLVCILLFIKEDYFGVLFELFKYWWFVLYLVIAIGLLYLAYRLLKNEKVFAVFLIVLSLSMACLQYAVVVEEMFIPELVFVARALGCIPVGILISYIPNLKIKKFNPCILLVAVLIPALLFMAYGEKTFLTRLVMIAMFGALMYFSVNISVGGRVFDAIGKLSVRMYLYMAFITMLYLLGLTNHRVLFVIDVTLAVMDLTVDLYRTKCKSLKLKEKELLKI